MPHRSQSVSVLRIAAIVSVFGTTLGVADLAAAAGPPPPGLQVQVINPSTNPVPVTGSTTVSGTVGATQSGTWNVGISGMPTVSASQSGSWNVGITGTPTVKVSNEPNLQTPYSNRANGSTCGVETDPCTVPAGSRLVIEYISGVFEASVNPTNDAGFVVNDSAAGLGGSPLVHRFIGYPVTGSVAGLFAFSTPFRMMLNSGAQFYLFGAGAEDLSVTGYLIAQP